MAATSFVVTASRAGVGSAVVTETDTKTYNVADVGTITEGGSGGGGGGGSTTVNVMVLA